MRLVILSKWTDSRLPLRLRTYMDMVDTAMHKNDTGGKFEVVRRAILVRTSRARVVPIKLCRRYVEMALELAMLTPSDAGTDSTCFHGESNWCKFFGALQFRNDDACERDERRRRRPCASRPSPPLVPLPPFIIDHERHASRKRPEDTRQIRRGGVLCDVQ